MENKQLSSDQATLSLPVAEWLQLRHQLLNGHTQDILLNKLDEEIALLATSDPDHAVEILAALTASDITDDRDVAAIYVGRLFTTRPEQAHDLMQTLLQDSDEEIREKAFETLEEVSDDNKITTDQAVRLAQTYYAASPPSS